MPTVATTAFAGVVLAAALAACSSGTSSTTSSTAPGAASSSAASSSAASSGAATGATPTITIQNFAFGQPLTVKPGTTVTVTNGDAAPHNVTAKDGSFKTNNITKGQTTTFVAPSTAGSYAFTCTIHPRMQGTLIVSDAASAAGGAGSPPVVASTGGDRGGGHGSDDTRAPGGGPHY